MDNCLAKKLEAAGIDRKQAEAHANALNEAVEPHLVTKSVLTSAVAVLEAKIDGMGQRFEAALWKHTAGLLLGVLAIGGL